MAAQGWFSRNETAVEPGSSAVLHLTVANLGEATDTFSVAPVGLASAWTTIRPAVVTLFGGSEEVLDIEVNAPMLPSTTAGPTALTVRIVPQSDPDDVATAETTLLVGVRSDRRILMLQPAIRSRRRATFELMFENRGNTQASCRLRLVDPSGRLDADFDPPSIGVEPGGSSVAKMRVRAKRRQWDRRSRTISFNVEADQPTYPTAISPATFVQAPMLPERLWGRLAAITLTAAALGAAWFGLLKPAIDRAATKAVDDRPPAQIVVATTVVAPVDNSTPVTAPPVQAEDGAPFNVRMSPVAPAGTTQSATYVPPAGSSLRITDLVLQNQNLDSGTAVLRRGAEVIFTWRLENITFDDQKSFVGDVEILPGDELVFEVSCTGVGVPEAGTCSAALQVIGQLLPTT
jgi:hypothetical protein